MNVFPTPGRKERKTQEKPSVTVEVADGFLRCYAAVCASSSSPAELCTASSSPVTLDTSAR